MTQIPESLSSLIAQEIYDEIIDLIDDKKTFVSCSLVCRGWVPRTRAHLFDGEVTINFWNSGRFIDILSSEHLTIGTYIKQLVFDGHDEENHGACMEPQVGRKQSADWMRLIVPYFHKLPFIYSVGFMHLDWIHLGPTVMRALAENFPLINEVTIILCVFPTFNHVLEAFCAFPSAPRFDVHKVICYEDDYDEHKYIRQGNFDCLTTDIKFPGQKHHRSILKWLLSHEEVPLSHCLHLLIHSVGSEESFKPIFDYVRKCGTALVYLKLRFPKCPSLAPAEQIAANIVLHANTRLQTLTISGGEDCKGDVFLSNVAWPILSQINSPELQTVIFIADEMTFFVEEQLIDFTVQTNYFCRDSITASSSAKKDVKFKLYGYSAAEADALQEYVRKNIHQSYELDMSVPVKHLTYFERVMQDTIMQAQNNHSAFSFVDLGPLIASLDRDD